MADILFEFIGEIIVELLWFGVYDRWKYLLMKRRKPWKRRVLQIICGVLTILFWAIIGIVVIKICEIVLP